MAPANWATQYGTTHPAGNTRRLAKAKVTAGFQPPYSPVGIPSGSRLPGCVTSGGVGQPADKMGLGHFWRPLSGLDGRTWVRS